MTQNITVSRPKQQRRPTADDGNHVNPSTPSFFPINELMTQYRDHHGISGPSSKSTSGRSVISSSPKLFTNIVKRTRAGLLRNRLRGGPSSAHQVQTNNSHLRVSNTDNSLTASAVVRDLVHTTQSRRSRSRT